MATQRYNPILLFIALTIALLSGCTTVTLTKSKALLETESLYEQSSGDLKQSENAQVEFSKAGETLEAAAQAETEQAMEALVYIANNQINKARQVAEIEASKKRMREIRTLKLNLRNKHHKIIKEK